MLIASWRLPSSMLTWSWQEQALINVEVYRRTPMWRR